jgi:hypothetical protein
MTLHLVPFSSLKSKRWNITFDILVSLLPNRGTGSSFGENMMIAFPGDEGKTCETNAEIFVPFRIIDFIFDIEVINEKYAGKSSGICVVISILQSGSRTISA